MTLYETEDHEEDNNWGGSDIIGCTDPESLLYIWIELRKTFDSIWLHNTYCEIYNPHDFREKYIVE